jgi:hypothetical protein
VSSITVFVERYIAFSVPAACLLIAYASTAVFSGVQRRQWLWITAALVALNPLMLKRFIRVGAEEYGPAIRIINGLSDSGRVPVFVRSPLIESNYQNWQAGVTQDSYLFAPVVAYPLLSRVVPLPNSLDMPAREFVVKAMSTYLGSEKKLLMLGHWDDHMLPWISDYMRTHGYQVHEWQPNGIVAVEFVKESSGVHPAEHVAGPEGE